MNMQQLLTPLWPAPVLELPEPPAFLSVPGTTADSDDVHALFRRRFRREPGKKLHLGISASPPTAVTGSNSTGAFSVSAPCGEATTGSFTTPTT